MTSPTPAVIRQVGTYASGIPSLEIHVALPDAAGLPYELDTRVPITLRVGGTVYDAGLRATERSALVWISPDMKTLGGRRTSLGEVLPSAGFKPNDRVALITVGASITVEMMRSPVASTRGVRSVSDLSRDPNAGRRPTRAPGANGATDDPLREFDWSTLYARYDSMCVGFDPRSNHLIAVEPRPRKDRELYYWLVENLGVRTSSQRFDLNRDEYRAVLYWKLYSQPAALSNIGRWFADDPRRIDGALEILNSELPSSISRDWQDIREALETLDRVRLVGMQSTTALPVRTTLLHLLFPSNVPILDKMVLKAVGIWTEGANTRLDVFKEYLPVAWSLADRHQPQLKQFFETPIRLIDMALWVHRGSV